MRRTNGLTADERGSAMVEFAMVVPLLVLLLFGIVEFSLMYNRQQALHAAAREGGRVASLETSTHDAIVDAVNSALIGTTFSSTAVISITPDTTRPCLHNAGETVTVTVTADSDVDIPVWQSMTVGLVGQARFRCE